jgi:AcrR family transcriptional regulator
MKHYSIVNTLGKVKSMSTRRYDSSRRQEGAARTRQQILDAGRALFMERGYAATTMGEVSARAKVAPATANAAFGGKAGLLKRLVDVGIAGDDEDIPVSERDAALQISAEPDPRRQCAMMAELVTEIHQRLAPLDDVLQQASGVDEQVRDEVARSRNGRRQGMQEFVDSIDPAALRPDLNRDRAADIVWALTEPRLFMGLVHERGWSPADFSAWLSGQLTAALLR